MRLVLRTSSATSEGKAKAPVPPTQSSIYQLANLITEFRTTLRLTYLIPLFAQLQPLLSSSPSTTSQSPRHPDPHSHFLTLLTTITYILYQLTENLAHLADHRLFLGPLTTIIPQQHIVTQAPGTSNLWFLSNRLWHAGVTLDLVRAARALYLSRRPANPTAAAATTSSQTAQIQEADRDEKVNPSIDLATTTSPNPNPTALTDSTQFHTDLLVATCWWPLTLHWSLRSGLRGIDDLAIGILGTLANWLVLRGQWTTAAADVDDVVDSEGGGKEKKE